MNKKLPLPDAKEVRERLKSTVDTRRIMQLEKMSRYALTGKWESRGQYATGSTEWPWYQSIELEWIEGGRSNKIMNANRQKKSRLLTGDIEPDSEGPSVVISSARKGFFKERYKGVGHGNPWRPHVYSYFDAYDLLGVGCTYHALTENPETGKYCSDARSIAPQHVLWSRLSPNPLNSPWVCVRHVLTVEEAKAEFPNAWQGAVEHLESVGHSQSMPVVVMIEYFDIGIGGKAPTHMVWLKDWNGDCVRRERNPWGRFLPVAFMVNNIMPDARYPVGGVFSMLKTQMVINEIERGIVDRIRNGPVRIWNNSKVNNQDLDSYFSGANKGNIRLATGEDPETLDNILMQVVGASLTNADIEGLEHFERQHGEDAALSETDQNSILQSQRTLGEINQIQAAAASNRAFDDQNVKEGLLIFAEKVFYTAKTGDDDPVEITLVLPDQRKRKMVVNQDEDSSCQELFAQQANLTLDVSNLTATDATQRSMKRIQDLTAILQFISLNPMSVQKYGDKLAQEAIMAIGEDPNDWAQATPGLQQLAAGQMPSPMMQPA